MRQFRKIGYSDRTSRPAIVTLKTLSRDGSVRKRRSPTPNAAQTPTQGALIAAISSEKARKIAHMVCCQDMPATRCLPNLPLRTAERYGMKYLKDALDELIAHFKKQVAPVADE